MQVSLQQQCKAFKGRVLRKASLLVPRSAQISKVHLFPPLLPELRDLSSLTKNLMFSYLQIVGPILQGIGGCRNDAILSQLGLKRADDLVCVLNPSLQVQGSLSPGEGRNDRTRLAMEDPVLLLFSLILHI